MKKVFIALALIFVANCCNGGSDTSHMADYYAYLYEQHEKVERKCVCDCQKQEPTFYRGQIVWDVVSGEGIIKSIKQDSSILYTIYVAFPGGAVRVYTMDGKHFETDLLPSLYPYKVKIIEDR